MVIDPPGLKIPPRRLGKSYASTTNHDPLREAQIQAIADSGQRFAARIAGLLQARHVARESACPAASPSHLPVPPESADADRCDQ